MAEAPKDGGQPEQPQRREKKGEDRRGHPSNRSRSAKPPVRKPQDQEDFPNVPSTDKKGEPNQDPGKPNTWDVLDINEDPDESEGGSK